MITSNRLGQGKKKGSSIGLLFKTNYYGKVKVRPSEGQMQILQNTVVGYSILGRIIFHAVHNMLRTMDAHG